MLLSREIPAPHAHHVDLMEAVAPDVRRHLGRLGGMRCLAVVELRANGCYHTSFLPALEVRLATFEGYGIHALEAIDLLDEVMGYDTAREAVALVVETNPIDGALASFIPLELPPQGEFYVV